MADPHPHHVSNDDRSTHDHAGGHVHAPKDFGRAFAVGVALNAAFIIVEATYGFLANSVALLADAGHNLSDVFGLLMAWGATALVKRPPTARYTYGFGATTILAALANATLLLVATGAIAWEALHRLGTPAPVAGETVMIVAAIGIAVNGFTAWLFMAGRHDDINIQGAFTHMAADALVSLGVVFAGLGMSLSGWLWLDPLVSLVIAGVIVWGTWGLLRGSLSLALHAVPASIEPADVRRFLEALPGVAEIHDLHIWPMSTTGIALTCHLVMPSGHPGDAFIARTATALKTAFDIGHTTLQIETGDAGVCQLAAESAV